MIGTDLKLLFLASAITGLNTRKSKLFLKAFLLKVSDPLSPFSTIKRNISNSVTEIFYFDDEKRMISIPMMPDVEAQFGDSTVHGNSFREYSGKQSCTVVIGETVIFLGAGRSKIDQISQLTSLGLKRIGTLPFPLRFGACLVMGSHLFLGFGRENRRSCYSR